MHNRLVPSMPLGQEGRCRWDRRVDAARTGGSNNRVEHMSWSTSEALSFGKIWRQRFLKRFVTGTRTAGGCEGVYCSFIPTRGASSALLVPSEVRPCETKSPEETSFVELEHACRPHVFSMQPPFRPRVCSLQPVLHPTDEMDETMYDETTTTRGTSSSCRACGGRRRPAPARTTHRWMHITQCGLRHWRDSVSCCMCRESSLWS